MMLTNSLLGRSGLTDLVPLLVGELQNTLDRLQMTLWVLLIRKKVEYRALQELQCHLRIHPGAILLCLQKTTIYRLSIEIECTRLVCARVCVCAKKDTDIYRGRERERKRECLRLVNTYLKFISFVRLGCASYKNINRNFNGIYLHKELDSLVLYGIWTHI